MRRAELLLPTLLAVTLAAALLAATDARPAASQARLTIFARPTVVGWVESALLYGTAAGAGPQDVVAIQVKECGSNIFRAYAEAHVNAGGGWSMPVGTSVTSAFRAVWRGSPSRQVTIRQRANVVLAPKRSGSGLTVAVMAKRSFWRKQVEIQRRVSGSWRTVRTVRLVDSVKSTGTISASEATFRLSVPAGTQLRALLPSEQAGPCYVRSVSKVLRT